jgi:hypothetical protein
VAGVGQEVVVFSQCPCRVSRLGCPRSEAPLSCLLLRMLLPNWRSAGQPRRLSLHGFLSFVRNAHLRQAISQGVS